MIITLVSHERNLGILPLTDHIINTLGKDNCAVVGTNYLVKDLTSTLNSIDKFLNQNKSVIIKYIIPKQRFSNIESGYPEKFEKISDLAFRVPTFTEELIVPVPIHVFKGEDNPFLLNIKKYYGHT